MNGSRAAIRYAKAVLDLSLERKAAEAVERDMRKIVHIISENTDLQDMLSSPIVKSDLKQETLMSEFKGSHDITENLIRVLITNKRIALLHEVAQKYIERYEELKGEGVAYVTTAVPLTPELEKDILKQVQKITGNKVTIKNKVDEKLIGGFVLRVGDLQYDDSIANKLNNLRREFTTSI